MGLDIRNAKTDAEEYTPCKKGRTQVLKLSLASICPTTGVEGNIDVVDDRRIAWFELGTLKKKGCKNIENDDDGGTHDIQDVEGNQ